jgi:ribonuclease J
MVQKIIKSSQVNELRNSFLNLLLQLNGKKASLIKVSEEIKVLVPQVPAEYSSIFENVDSQGFYAAFGGGVGSFGANFAIFYADNTTIWIDCGAGFGNQNLPGISKTLPHGELLRSGQPDAIIITHGHEDHIGALGFLGGLLKKHTPVYCSAYTAALLRIKLKDAGVNAETFDLKIIEVNQSWQVNDFEVRNFFMPHSIPQTFSVGLIHQKFKEKLYFTSDFKIDGHEPRFNQKDIADFGPVDYCFLDSTGSLSPGRAGAEQDLQASFTNLLENWSGRIFITTFASQIERIKFLIMKSLELNRPLGLLGFSMKTYLKAARESGEFDPGFELTNPSPRAKGAIWLIAGCQADQYSSFNRLSLGELNGFRTGPNDLVIYSASIVPGNEEPVFEALNRIARTGARMFGVNPEERKLVHRSGHGKQEEQRQLLDLIQPRKVVPVHGDPLHFRSLAENDTFTGYNVLYAEGAVVYRLDAGFQADLTLSPQPLYVEQNEIHTESRLYHIRKEIGNSGVFTLSLDRFTGKLLGWELTGVCSQKRKNELREDIERKLGKLLTNQVFPLSNTAQKKLRSKLQNLCRDFFGRSNYVQLMLCES